MNYFVYIVYQIKEKNERICLHIKAVCPKESKISTEVIERARKKRIKEKDKRKEKKKRKEEKKRSPPSTPPLTLLYNY